MLIFVGPTNADLNDTLQVPQAAHRCQLHPAPNIRADIPQCNVEPIDDRRFHNGERMPPPRCTRVHLRPSAPLCRSLPLGQIIVVVGKSGFRNSCQYQNPSDEYPHSPLPFRARVEHLRDRSWMFFDVDLGLAERRLLKRLIMPAPRRVQRGSSPRRAPALTRLGGALAAADRRSGTEHAGSG